MKKFLVVSVAFVLMAAVAVRLWYGASLGPVDASDDTRKTVTIEKGWSVTAIAAELSRQGLIHSELAFRTYVKMSDLSASLQAGKYVLKPSLSVEQIAETLRSGKAEEMIITVPEGFTVFDIDALLASKGLSSVGEFSRCARECDLSRFSFLPDREGLAERGGTVEGYAYPDTYFVSAGDFTAEAFLARMLSTFEKKVIRGLSKDIESSGRSLHDIVTMASLIEEEAANDEERPVIGGILWKRLDSDFGLGVDATVRYILNKSTDAITVADLNQNDPYNTRKFRGLPPGPIASPGYESIVAALHPTETEYWYYLHGNDGKIRYAKSNEEHNVNRNTYLR